MFTAQSEIKYLATKQLLSLVIPKGQLVQGQTAIDARYGFSLVLENMTISPKHFFIVTMSFCNTGKKFDVWPPPNDYTYANY